MNQEDWTNTRDLSWSHEVVQSDQTENLDGVSDGYNLSSYNMSWGH
jgi:hypothetical protein